MSRGKVVDLKKRRKLFVMTETKARKLFPVTPGRAPLPGCQQEEVSRWVLSLAKFLPGHGGVGGGGGVVACN